MINEPGLKKSKQSGGEIKIENLSKEEGAFFVLVMQGTRQMISLGLTSDIHKMVQSFTVQELRV